MKVLLLASFALSGFALAESAIPSAYARERYTETFSASPFALATPPPEKVEEVKDSPLNNLVVTGMGKLDDGRDFVIVQRIGEEGSMRFEGLNKNGEGIAVKEVKWGERWGQSSVVMTYQSEQKEIKFKENSAPVAVTPAPQQGQRGVNPSQRGGNPAVNTPPPIVPTGLNSAARPTGIPKQGSMTPTIPRPGGNIQVPRPGAGVQLQPTTTFRGAPGSVPGTAGAPTPTNGGAPRTRVRSINNR